MSLKANGSYEALYDFCEDLGWHIQLAGGVDSPIVIEVRDERDSVRNAFKVPTGRSLDEAAAALLSELRRFGSPS